MSMNLAPKKKDLLEVAVIAAEVVISEAEEKKVGKFS
jgi:hypothetical protein